MDENAYFPEIYRRTLSSSIKTSRSVTKFGRLIRRTSMVVRPMAVRPTSVPPSYRKWWVH